LNGRTDTNLAEPDGSVGRLDSELASDEDDEEERSKGSGGEEGALNDEEVGGQQQDVCMVLFQAAGRMLTKQYCTSSWVGYKWH
jgi:hypothetical protein